MPEDPTLPVPAAPAPQTVTMIDPHGGPHDVPVDQVEHAQLQGFRVEGAGERDQRLTTELHDETYGGAAGAVGSVVAGTLRGGTLGLSDVLARAQGGDAAAQQLQAYERLHPDLSAASEFVGAAATALPTGGESFLARTPGAAIGRLGARVAGLGEGAGVIGRVGAGAAGGVVEGALYGAGSGVSELALDDKPLTVEHIASTLSSNMVYGGLVGGAVGSVGKIAELGLTKAKGAIDRAVETHAARAAVTDDLAQLDLKGLRAAKDTELETIKTTHKAELDRIEADRAVERKSIADDLADLRRSTKDEKHFLTTENVELPEVEGKLAANEIGAKASKAERQLRGVLDDPRGLADNPRAALKALRIQEDAMTALIDRDADLRAVFSADKTPKRMNALDSIPAALEKNRALQARITEVSKALPELPKTSARLDSIAAAKDALQMGGGKPSFVAKLPEQMLQGTVFGAVTAAAAPVVGHFAPMIGAGVSKFVAEKVFGGLGKASSAAVARTGKAVSAFLDTSRKVTKVATPIASKTLATVRYAPPDPSRPKPAAKPQKGAELAQHFTARADELRSQVTAGPDGRSVMRPEAREAMAQRLSPIAAAHPLLADQIETLLARKIQFLADKLPRRPDLAGMGLIPDKWQPSDMEMRKFARYAAGVEDPGGIEERLASGQISPEDGEVMREVYPERLAEITQQIMSQLQSLQKSLPYQRKLALSIFSGVPVDPAMDPRVLNILQRNFAIEAGTGGGTMAPRAQAQFGSVSKSLPEPTPAQRRAG